MEPEGSNIIRWGYYREEKIIEERERRNTICCMCRCHTHLAPLTIDETLITMNVIPLAHWIALYRALFEANKNMGSERTI